MSWLASAFGNMFGREKVEMGYDQARGNYNEFIPKAEAQLQPYSAFGEKYGLGEFKKAAPTREQFTSSETVYGKGRSRTSTSFDQAGFDAASNAYDQEKAAFESQGLGLAGLARDPSQIQRLPYYNFIMQQGLEGIGRMAGAKGKFFSGENAQDMMTFASGVASQTYNDEWNRRAGIAGMGQQAGNTLANVYMTSAGDLASLRANQGRDAGAMRFKGVSSGMSMMMGGFGGSTGSVYGGGSS